MATEEYNFTSLVPADKSELESELDIISDIRTKKNQVTTTPILVK